MTFRCRLLFVLCLAVALQSVKAHNDDSCKKITIAATGDIMMGTLHPEDKHYYPSDDGVHLFDSVAPFLKSADIVFGNLEGVFLNEKIPAKTCKDSTVCYAFRMPEKYVVNLMNAGYNVMSVANNHAGDFGLTGKRQTAAVLKSAGIAFAGFKPQKEYDIFTKNHIKYGFCAFAPNSNMVDIRDTARAKKIVAFLDSVCDIVIVSMHGGCEGKDYTHVPKKNELFYGENRGNVHHFAHACIRAGADVVIGHGPHVVRAVELYNQRFIAYSLGNFCTPYGISREGLKGYAPLILIETDTTGRFQGGRIISARQFDRSGPKPDKARVVIREIQKLTAADFPSSPLQIEDDGRIFIKKEL